MKDNSRIAVTWLLVTTCYNIRQWTLNITWLKKDLFKGIHFIFILLYAMLFSTNIHQWNALICIEYDKEFFNRYVISLNILCNNQILLVLLLCTSYYRNLLLRTLLLINKPNPWSTLVNFKHFNQRWCLRWTLMSVHQFRAMRATAWTSTTATSVTVVMDILVCME